MPCGGTDIADSAKLGVSYGERSSIALITGVWSNHRGLSDGWAAQHAQRRPFRVDRADSIIGSAAAKQWADLSSAEADLRS